MSRRPLFSRIAALFAMALTIGLLANRAEADPPPWEPMTPPAEVEGPVQILVLAIDGSGSMQKGRSLSPRAKAAGRHAVAEVERCSYVIIAVFGSDADVVADRFACSPHDRQVLLDAVETVPMNASRTDVQVLEGLLTHIRDALTEHYADRGFRMEVQVLTDGHPDPVDRSEQQTFDVILEQRTTRTELGDGLVLYGLTFDQEPFRRGPRRDVVLAPSGPAPAVSEQLPTAESPPGFAEHPAGVGSGAVRTVPLTDNAPSGAAAPGVAGTNRARTGLVMAGVVVLLLAIGVFLAARRRAQREAEAVLQDTGQADVVPIKSPAGLRITEWKVSEQGERALVQGPLAVHYTPNVPITLGSDEGRVLVGLRTPGLSARLAAITLDGRGNGVVVPLNGTFLFFDGEEVAGRVEFSAEHAHVLKVGSTEVHIEPASTLPETEDALYRRLAEGLAERPDGDDAVEGAEEAVPDHGPPAQELA